MADKHPYMSGSAGLVQAVNHLRKSFPPEVTAETLKKLGIAPNNETYVINILRFINVLDEEGKKTAKASSVFSKHEDREFQQGLSEMVQAAYADLFSLHGNDAWSLSTDKLISFFRGADQSSAIVGQRQAGTFETLAALSGHGETPAPRSGTTARRVDRRNTQTTSVKKMKPEAKITGTPKPDLLTKTRDMGLTVRIEINLPPAADKETYDHIFKSIRENLLDAE